MNDTQITSLTSSKFNPPSSPRQMVDSPTHDFYVAHISEEKSGKPVPGVPIKILGVCPRGIGEKVAQLIKNRYTEADLNSLQCQSRSKLASVMLKSSYIVIHFKLPSDNVYYPTKTKAFTRFASGLRAELTTTRPDHIFLHRRRRANGLTASALLSKSTQI
jgi:hypothetical protein